MLFAPLEGWRHVEVTDRHAALDYAQVLKDLSDRHFRTASKIGLVQDNLSTHKPASLYAAFPAAEARRGNGFSVTDKRKKDAGSGRHHGTRFDRL